VNTIIDRMFDELKEESGFKIKRSKMREI